VILKLILSGRELMLMVIF